MQSYIQFRERLRREFDYRCGYCGVAETILAPHGTEGTGLMAIDNFRPLSRFPSLADTVENLVYCCRFCNRSKASWWSDDPEEQILHRRMEGYENHLQLQDSGFLMALSGKGPNTLHVMDLNDPRKVKLRQLEIRTVRERQQLVARLSDFLEKIGKLSLEMRGEAITSLRTLLEPLRETF
jgi:hypothetical protein